MKVRRRITDMRVFFDQDGTLAEFRYVPLEELYVPGYFLSLGAHRNVISAMKLLMDMPGTEVYALTSVLKDHPTARDEKLKWFKKYTPFLPEERIIFSSCGRKKADYVKDLDITKDILVDDFGENIRSWPACCVKVSMDPEDMRKEMLKHAYCINPDMSAEDIVREILSSLK